MTQIERRENRLRRAPGRQIRPAAQRFAGLSGYTTYD
jgi:hypothetical protein